MDPRYFYWLLCTLVFFVFQSCSESQKVIENKTFNIQLTDEIKSFPLPEDMGHFNLDIQTTDENRLYLYDYGSNKIVIYSLDDSELLHEIKFETEGPNGMGSSAINGVLIENRDSIYFLVNSRSIFRFDQKGMLQETIEMEADSLLAAGSSLFGGNFYRKNKEFYFPSLPLIFAWNELTPAELSKLPNVVSYDIGKDFFKPVSFYPKEFIGDDLNKSIFPTLTEGADGMLLINHNFRNIFMIEGQDLISIPAYHSGFPKDPPSSNSNMFEDMNEIMRIINHVDIYRNLYYSKHQEVYVRVAKFEDIPENSMGPGQHIAARWGLVFLDKEFNRIGELDLPENRFNGLSIFTDAEGIWISIDHPNHPDLSEDYLKFQLIQIIK